MEWPLRRGWLAALAGTAYMSKRKLRAKLWKALAHVFELESERENLLQSGRLLVLGSPPGEPLKALVDMPVREFELHLDNDFVPIEYSESNKVYEPLRSGTITINWRAR